MSSSPPPNPFRDTPAETPHTSETPIAAAPPKSESEDMTTHVNQEVTTPPAPAPAQQHPETTAPTLETTTPSSPTHIPAAPPPPVTQPRDDERVDPAIASLVAIFPTFDHDLLREILRECGGNEEQAVDILLGMSDPSHVPTINATAVSPLLLYSFPWCKPHCGFGTH